MNRLTYSLLLYLLSPLVMIKLLWRSRKSPAYRRRWGERFGFARPLPSDKPIIWIHTVSVGETIASAPLVMALLERHSGYRFLITTMTPTGSERVKSIYGDSVEHQYMPYDLPDAQSRYLNRVRPKLAIIFETELWPNSIAGCYKRGIPVIIANARLSERSAKGYRRLGRLTSNMLKQVSVVACQNKEDSERFLQLGLPKKNLEIIGSVKFDIDVSAEVLDSAHRLRASWEQSFGRKPQIVIAASTHAGEEQLLLEAYLKLNQQHRDLLLIIVPRHQERFDAVYTQACYMGLVVKRYSHQPTVTPDTQVILGDTMGELMKYYAVSDIAFVGGSLIERGGHNVLEPAILGIPVLSGPHVFNFQLISTALSDAGGLFFVKNIEEVISKIDKLLLDKNHCETTGINAKAFVDKNRGALARLLKIISTKLKNIE